jgi:CubicO group peptidase (beta-lactamase class C family)
MLAERMANNGVVVGVIDASGPRVVAHGRSGAGDDRPLDGDTVFQIGSVTKTITTLLLAEMVVRGALRLDDHVAEFLPGGVSMPERGRAITLRDLATHRSGLPRMPTNFDLHGDPDPYEAYSVEQLYEFLSTYALDREPGARAAYSNLGVALLGRVLARRMDTEYEALVKDFVLEPLGMESTSISLSEDQLRRLAPGHDRYLHTVREWEMATLPASGSLRSTANDMLDLLAAYLGYRNTPLQAAMRLQRDEALAWAMRADGLLWHSGGKAGYRSGIALNASTGIGAVVLVNARTDASPMDIAIHLVTGEALQPAPPLPEYKERVELSRATLQTFEGRYRADAGVELEVARSGSRLLVRYPSGAILEFVATGPRDFFYHGGNDDITFEVAPDGVTGLMLYGDGKKAGGAEPFRRVGE